MGDPTAASRAISAERRKTARGLALPNPAFRRYRTLPSADASLVAVTNGTTATTLGASSRLIIPSSNLFTWSGPRPSIRTSSTYEHKGVVTPVGALRACADFLFYGQKFEWVVRPNNAAYRIWVDGVPASAAPVDFTNSGADNFMLLDFGTTARRRIKLEMIGLYWRGIQVGPSDTVLPTDRPFDTTVCFLGDSFTGGALTTSVGDAWGRLLADLWGWDDAWIVGYGGTGYLNPFTGVTTLARVPDVIYSNADVVFVASGLNDATYNPGTGIVTASQIAAAALATTQGIKAGLPQATIVQIGPWVGSGTSAALVAPVGVAMRAAALGAGSGVDLYIDNILGQWAKPNGHAGPVEGAWLSGSGHENLIKSDGNADLFRGTDGVHPTQLGHDYYARRVAAYLAQALPL